MQTQFSQKRLHLPPFFSSVVDSYIFFVSTLFLFLLFVSQPSILPVLMWQAWEMKSWYFMSSKEEHLLFLAFACKRGQKRKKKIIWEVKTLTHNVSFFFFLKKGFAVVSEQQSCMHLHLICSVCFISVQHIFNSDKPAHTANSQILPLSGVTDTLKGSTIYDLICIHGTRNKSRTFMGFSSSNM